MSTPMARKVYADGRYLGEYLPSGDEAQDRATVANMRHEAGLPPMVHRSVELRAYDNAKSYADAARILDSAAHGEARVQGVNLIVPSVSTAAFAIELYLKAIGYATGNKLHRHELLKLYTKLDARIQAQLESEFVAVVTAKTGRGKDLKRTLEMMSDSFVDWRYPYETKKKGLMFKPGDALSLLEALDNTCRALLVAKGLTI